MTGSSTSTIPFRFSSYGVNVEIGGNDQSMIDEGVKVAKRCLLGQIEDVVPGPIEQTFSLDRTGLRTYRMSHNGESIATAYSRWKFFHYFDGIVRVSVGERARGKVFLHSGAVAWNGKGIIMPADSMQGKTTLVHELVRCGAEYYSDEFAVLDEEGLLHPFARPLSMRTPGDRTYAQRPVNVDEIGGRIGEVPVPVRMILLTSYEPRSRWKPEYLTPGQGVLAMIPNVLSIRHATDFSMRVLHKAASHAIIVSGSRGSAREFARSLLDFVDKQTD